MVNSIKLNYLNCYFHLITVLALDTYLISRTELEMLILRLANNGLRCRKERGHTFQKVRRTYSRDKNT